MSHKEKERLGAVAADSWYLRPTNARMIEFCAKIFLRHIQGGRVLEMGPAEGLMSPYLSSVADNLTLLDGAEIFCERLRKQFPQAEVVHSLFEEFKPVQQFDSVVLGHVLEHVIDPLAILKLVKTWLKPEGRILAAVPNAHSIHRQAAVLMGLLSSEDAMNEADIHHGHRRVFTPVTFNNLFSQAGFYVEISGGYWLKPVSNRQIEEAWTSSMLDAFMQLGERYPDIAGEIYIVGRNQVN